MKKMLLTLIILSANLVFADSAGTTQSSQSQIQNLEGDIMRAEAEVQKLMDAYSSLTFSEQGKAIAEITDLNYEITLMRIRLSTIKHSDETQTQD